MTTKPKPRTPEQRAGIDAARQYLTASKAMGAPQAVLSYAAAQLRAALSSKAAPAKATPAKAAPAKAAPAASPAPAPAPVPPAPPASTINPFELARAKALVAESDAIILAARKAELVEKLRAVRAALAAKKPQLQALVGQVRQRDATGEALDANIARRRERIALLQHERSPVFDFLPSDPEAVSWQAEVSKLEEECKAIQAAANALPNPYQLKLEYVELQAAVQQLGWNERSILNQLSNLEGRKFTTWGGKDVSDAAVLHMPF